MTRRRLRLALTIVAVVVGFDGSDRSAAQGGPRVSVVVLSNRADLIASGDALIEVVAADRARPATAGLRVAIDDRDVSDAFALRADSRFIGLVSGLRNGRNLLRVTDGGRVVATLAITNHPIGGPIFSGPHLRPWTCSTTTAPSLGEPVDADCNAPTQFRYVYRSTAGRFLPYVPDGPTPADMAMLTLAGISMPYVVRIERGTMNRGLHEIAVVFDPAKPWQPWATQPQWNRKLVMQYGAGTSQQYRQGTPDVVLNHEALSLGFLVASSSMLVNSQHANFVTAAETTMMLKEHIIETYGELRYTVGAGSSGGALLQHLIADAYPGLLDGLRPIQDWEDSISGAYREFADSAALMQAFTTSSLTFTPAERAAIGGWGAANVNVFTIEAGRVGDYNRPDDGTKCAGEDSYDPVARPTGVRCTFQDFIVNQIGRRPDGAAHLVFDNVGVQYGLAAVKAGQITAEQFIDVNARAGGFDVNGRWQEARSAIAPAVAAVLHRTGQITSGKGLAEVAEIAIRGTNNNDYHYPFRTMVNRHRLTAANGHADNHVFLIQPQGETTLVAMDRWLTAVHADRSADPLNVKIVKHKPADVVSACWIDGTKITDLAACDARFPYFREPRTVAGDGPTLSTMKCQLRPPARGEYGVPLTDAQWARLTAVFPTGVCDFSKPGVGAQPTQPWLTYTDGPGGRPLGEAPRSAG